MRLLKIIILIAILAAIGASGWWYGWGPCGRVYIDTAYQQWTDILKRWNTTEDRIKPFIGRYQLQDVAKQLWPIRDEMANTIVPACATSAGRKMTTNMDGRLSAYLASWENPDAAEYLMSIADVFNRGIDDAYIELETLRGCAPFCGK